MVKFGKSKLFMHANNHTNAHSRRIHIYEGKQKRLIRNGMDNVSVYSAFRFRGSKTENIFMHKR